MDTNTSGDDVRSSATSSQKRTYWQRVRAILCSGLSPVERLVLVAIADHVNDSGSCWPSKRRLSDLTGYSERTVQRSLSSLADRDVLQRLERRVGSEPSEGVCDRLAAGVRRYLERRSGEPAAEMTSFEIRLLLRRLGWPETVQRGIQQVMNTVDLVRFGRTSIEDRELRLSIERSRETAHEVESFLRQVEEESPAEAV